MNMLFCIFVLYSASTSSISTNVNSISMLNGTNFKDWKENILIVHGCFELDLAIRVTRPTIMNASFVEDKKELEMCDIERWKMFKQHESYNHQEGHSRRFQGHCA